MSNLSNVFAYHGKMVKIGPVGDEDPHDHHAHDMVSIDGSSIHIMILQDGTFATHYFPYWSYKSLEGLARDVIDKVPEFGPRLVKKGETSG